MGHISLSKIDVGETRSTIQDTPIGTTPIDAIALA
jgi:hypothetical protein